MVRALQVRSNDYMVPAAISLLLHGALLLAVGWGWEPSPEIRQRVTPSYVEAKLVAIQPEAAKPKATRPKPNVIDLTAREQQRREAEQKKRLAAEKAERERLRKLAEEKRKREAEQERKERLERERKERERIAEERRQKELERQRQQREADFAEALAEEEELLRAQQSEASAQSYVAAMADRIEHNWNRPPSARLGMKCELRIQLVPSGDVVHVAVVKSSGNAAFDRSAEQAVNKVGRFEVLKEMPPQMFEQYFRQVTLVFNPRDLRQ